MFAGGGFTRIKQAKDSTDFSEFLSYIKSYRSEFIDVKSSNIYIQPFIGVFINDDVVLGFGVKANFTFVQNFYYEERNLDFYTRETWDTYSNNMSNIYFNKSNFSGKDFADINPFVHIALNAGNRIRFVIQSGYSFFLTRNLTGTTINYDSNTHDYYKYRQHPNLYQVSTSQFYDTPEYQKIILNFGVEIPILNFDRKKKE